MTTTLGAFRAALLIGWLTLGAAALLYARIRDIPAWTALPLLAAFLIEYSFYLVPGFEAVRERLAGRRLPWLLAASMLLPYLVYSLGTGQFQAIALAKLASLALLVSFWYVLLPAGAAADLGLCALLAAVLLTKFLNPIYPDPLPRIDAGILGKLALIHTAAMVFLVQRRVPGAGFGFLPARREWWIGLRWYLYFLPFGLALVYLVKPLQFAPAAPWWKIAGAFFGALWVVALAEEFFFRGILQQWVEKWTGSAHVAVAAAALLFGASHLGFRFFPNWRMAVLAAAAGWFYGRAFQQARSIRASMVSHALVVATWRALFQ
jgi:membrane protease YdiL (CAAX protease family)